MFPDKLTNKLLTDFLHESVLHGARLLLGYTPFKYAKHIWSVFMIAVLVWTSFIITTLTIEYFEKPTEVRMSTGLVHVSNTPFPGVAVCNANKLNRTRVLNFAKKVFEKQQSYKPFFVAKTVEEMAQHLLVFKKFYVFPYDDEPLNITVIDGLDEIFTFLFNTTNYPVLEYLKKLAPSCKTLVVSGRIYEAEINITDYFHKRMTSSSVCCMFNYNRSSYSTNLKERQKEDRLSEKAKQVKFESSSILNSVQFALQSEPSDVTVTEFQTSAFQLYIFPREDYATIQSNRIGEILVDFHTIVEVPIEPEFYESSNRVRQFPPKVRNCYFPEEGQKILNQSYYSMDECLLLCRMDSMMKHCGCVAPPMAATNRNFTYCKLGNLPCLMQWKAIWYGWNYYDYVHENGKDLQDDLTSGHRCPKCLPSCNGVDFNLEVNVKTLRSNFSPLYTYGILNGLNTSKPLAVVKLYFKQRYFLATERDIVGDWVVLLNRFGGIMSLMFGFSIVSSIEMVYFATGKFFVFYFKMLKLKLEYKLSTRSEALEQKAEVTWHEEPPSDYNLYWKELKPERTIGIEKFKHYVIEKISRSNEI